MLDIRKRLAHENPTVTEYEGALAASHHSIGVLYSQTGMWAEALVAWKKALGIWERLDRENPTVIDYPIAVAGSHYNIGMVYSRTGKLADALLVSPVDLPSVVSDLGYKVAWRPGTP